MNEYHVSYNKFQVNIIGNHRLYSITFIALKDHVDRVKNAIDRYKTEFFDLDDTNDDHINIIIYSMIDGFSIAVPLVDRHEQYTVLNAFLHTKSHNYIVHTAMTFMSREKIKMLRFVNIPTEKLIKIEDPGSHKITYCIMSNVLGPSIVPHRDANMSVPDLKKILDSMLTKPFGHKYHINLPYMVSLFYDVGYKWSSQEIDEKEYDLVYNCHIKFHTDNEASINPNKGIYTLIKRKVPEDTVGILTLSGDKMRLDFNYSRIRLKGFTECKAGLVCSFEQYESVGHLFEFDYADTFYESHFIKNKKLYQVPSGTNNVILPQ